MGEFANKYQEEARLLVHGLKGTKWEARSGRTPSRNPVNGYVRSAGRFVQEKPVTALLAVAAVSFLYGALRN